MVRHAREGGHPGFQLEVYELDSRFRTGTASTSRHNVYYGTGRGNDGLVKLRCDLHLGRIHSKVILVAKPEEKLDHLAMKLAAYAMFLPMNPIVEPSSDHPALAGFLHKPDVFTLDESGGISIWIDCGAVTTHKLDKVSRRLGQSRVIVLKSSLAEAKRLRADLEGSVKNAARIEIWTWPPALPAAAGKAGKPDSSFQTWMAALEEKTEIFGEAHEKSFNLVVNNVAYAADLVEV